MASPIQELEPSDGWDVHASKGLVLMSKYIFVTGGVVSSIGKGITAASIGRLLKGYGIPISVQKLDPYLNVDPGTMSPYQHGEVFVTKDGGETDLDLGHYERFIDVDLTKPSNVTAGDIYSAVISKERRGDFLGGTIQTVPHVTNEIKSRMKRIADETGASVVIVEVGGTVGDIESLPFLEAVRQMRNEIGRENTLNIHVTLLPYISATGELKTKPTQHSVKELRSIGLHPDVIICRSDYPVPPEIKDKVALFCDVEKRAVIASTTADTIYEVPLILHDQGLEKLIAEKLDLPVDHDQDLRDWRDMVERIKAPKEPLPIAIVGKYVELPDAYSSVREALYHAGLYHRSDVEISWIQSEDLEKDGWEMYLQSARGIVVPGGFGPRGIEGMIRAANYAREYEVPYLGLCLGMQVMVIEFARHVLKSDEPNSTEFDLETGEPVVYLLPDQMDVKNKGGTMRLGSYPCRAVSGTLAGQAYDGQVVYERHRHRFEINNAYRELLGAEGMVYSGLSPDGELVEIAELRDHPFMLGCQFHPEFRSRPNRAHPLFRDFVGAAKNTLREGGQHPMPMVSEGART